MKIIGNITLEGDKSISHRALILASMCRGESVINNLPSSRDVLSTINCLRETGISIIVKNNQAIVIGGTFTVPSKKLNCDNSGTSMRLLAGLYSSIQLPVTLYGDSSLSKRPMKRIIDPLSQMGITIVSNKGKAPIQLVKFNLQPLNYEIFLASAQVKSCLILASINIPKKSIIKQNIKTRDHLELMIDSISKDIIEVNDNKIIINGIDKNSLNKFDIDIPGDTSSASYLIGLAVMLDKSKLIINNLLLNPLRTGFIDTLISMGADIKLDSIKNIKNERVGRLTVQGGAKLHPCFITKDKISSMIDEIPLLSLICAYVEGESCIDGLQELQYKESDRLEGVLSILMNMGVDVKKEKEFSLIIKGKNKLYNTNNLKHTQDHRLAMIISCAQILSEDKVVFDDCINISFPKFKELINEVLID